MRERIFKMELILIALMDIFVYVMAMYFTWNHFIFRAIKDTNLSLTGAAVITVMIEMTVWANRKRVAPNAIIVLKIQDAMIGLIGTSAGLIFIIGVYLLRRVL